jgi:hypothetical protein
MAQKTYDAIIVGWAPPARQPLKSWWAKASLFSSLKSDRNGFPQLTSQPHTNGLTRCPQGWEAQYDGLWKVDASPRTCTSIHV